MWRKRNVTSAVEIHVLASVGQSKVGRQSETRDN